MLSGMFKFILTPAVLLAFAFPSIAASANAETVKDAQRYAKRVVVPEVAAQLDADQAKASPCRALPGGAFSCPVKLNLFGTYCVTITLVQAHPWRWHEIDGFCSDEPIR
jgi:hypothetical protein